MLPIADWAGINAAAAAKGPATPAMRAKLEIRSSRLTLGFVRLAAIVNIGFCADFAAIAGIFTAP